MRYSDFNKEDYDEKVNCSISFDIYDFWSSRLVLFSAKPSLCAAVRNCDAGHAGISITVNHVGGKR